MVTELCFSAASVLQLVKSTSDVLSSKTQQTVWNSEEWSGTFSFAMFSSW